MPMPEWGMGESWESGENWLRRVVECAEKGTSGGKEVWRRPEGPAEDGLRRLLDTWVLSDGRFLGRERVGRVGEAWEGGDAMADVSEG